ncbi:Transmembrane and TPR repeat-containing protein 4 [Papilio machaon]|uniref:Transmembrane and TPR repeat-containing protein 4 n=1 Tax=Papilio machaon TaxID=76193 RepID=A0A0N1IEL8_PAPMA|nr:Transmembrane and TPR repeat-containing protein 4 [Papilio machaon]
MGGMKPEFKPGDNPAAFANNTFTKVATFHYIYFLNFLILLWPQWLCYDWSMGCLKLIEKTCADHHLLLRGDTVSALIY